MQTPHPVSCFANAAAELRRWRQIREMPMRINGPRGVTVSILDSESSDRGSNPCEGSLCSRHTSLHQSNR